MTEANSTTTEPKNAAAANGGKARTGSVQSIERAFGLLETMADAGGMMGLSQLATASGLPLPTIHRLVRTLVDLGYLRQEPSRQYVLGPRLIRLGESSSHMLSVWARPHLARLVDELGESANMAMLDGDQIVYLAQVPSRHSMRMFTEVGRRVLPHCTAVGKAILAKLPESEVRDLLHRTGMPQHTDNTLTTPDAFTTQLRKAEEHGYAMDEGEQEVGVRCVAVAVPDAPSRLAMSISGPAGRMTEALVERAVPLLTQAAKALSDDLR
ncbi:IclR family transcriptional regulator [Kribbella sp. NPDC051952]|uniref:IclR family transcriptional regulator n=1 Tax=Kribbella sp. NPDC051952 TaxID=3154851 RepID=UPI00341F1A8E